MASKLNRRASGYRHHQWGQDIQATINAHFELNDTLTDAQRQALTEARQGLAERLEALEGHVTAYSDFQDNAYRDIRAKQRVADHMCDRAVVNARARLSPFKEDIDDLIPGGFARIFSGKSLSRILRAGTEATVSLTRTAAEVIEALPERITDRQTLAAELRRTSEGLDTLNQERATTLDPQRIPLRLAVERASLELREYLEQMDGRLRTHFGRTFIDSLYPDLGRNRPQRDDDDSPAAGDEPQL